MADTIFKQIYDRLQTLLETGTPNGIPVYRNRFVPLARDITPALILYPISETPSGNEQLLGAIQSWAVQVQIEIMVRGEDPVTLADPYYQFAHAQIMADIRQNGLADLTEAIGGRWQSLEAETGPATALTLSYIIYTRTDRSDLTVKK